MGCNYNNWPVIIKKCTKRVISSKNILFLEFENFNFITCCARNISLDFNVIQLYFEIIFNVTRNFGYKYFGSHQNVGIFLNSVLSGCLKLLIVVLARSWAVLSTNCKWAIVNYIRIKNGLYILTNRKWAICSLPHTCGPSKLTRPLKKLS